MDTSRALKRSGARKPARATSRGTAIRPATAAARAAQEDDEAPEELEYEPEPLLPPEPDTAELIVRATHVEAPPIEGEADDERIAEPGRNAETTKRRMPMPDEGRTASRTAGAAPTRHPRRPGRPHPAGALPRVGHR